SSLPGAAATSVKIKGVTHEFSTLPHMKEDVVELMLNLKGLRFKLHNVPQSKVTLKVKGEKQVTGKDFECPSDVEVTNPSVKIATLSDKTAELEMEIIVEEGRGYVPVEAAEKKSYEHGTIALDAIYSPVKNANFSVENVRVGQMTNFDKVTMTIVTDGSLKPLEALQQAAKILVDHFTVITGEGSAATVETQENESNEALPEKSEDQAEPEKKEKKKTTRVKKDKDSK
ncbi:MAG: DNA-directed RNA polymerase subunit alpha, partial [Patescibacteria group bacterium]